MLMLFRSLCDTHSPWKIVANYKYRKLRVFSMKFVISYLFFFGPLSSLLRSYGSTLSCQKINASKHSSLFARFSQNAGPAANGTYQTEPVIIYS